MKLFHKQYILFVLLIAVIPAPAQRMMVDSLQRKASLDKATIENTKTILSLAEAYLIVNTDSSLIYSNLSLALAKQLNNKSLEADAYVMLGQTNDYVNRQPIALEYFLQARIIFEELKSDEGLASTFYAIAEMYNTLRELVAAKMYMRKSLMLYTILKDEPHIANAYGSLGNMFFKENNYDSAQYYNRLELLMGRQQNNIEVLQDALGNMADVLIAQNKFTEAETYLKEANDYADQMGSYYGIAYGKGQLAKIAIGRKQYANALQLANEIAAFGRQLKMDDLLMDAVDIKYKTYKGLHQADSALLYIEMYNALADTLTGKVKSLALDSLLSKYRFEKKQKEVELLKQTNKSHYTLIIAFCGALLLSGGLLFSFYRRNLERKKMNAQLQEQSLKLQNINQLKDRMFSIISHDLRGPVASLKSLIDFMKGNSLSNEESEMIVRELRQSVNGVDMLLENLLIWAKMQINGDIISKPEPLQVSSIVEESILLYQKSATQKNIQLQNKVGRNMRVMADSNYLSLIIRNLINNAIKFTENNGIVLIEATAVDGHVKICVEDNGIGMSNEDIDKLFNLEKPFSKLGTLNEKGSGLGLMFVKEYTERCGGKFSITSKKDKGSRFCITLPDGKC